MTCPFLCFMICAIIPITVFAGDEATLDFMGFSEDGAYLMFEQFGWQDGSGFPYSEIIFVDVINNSFVGAPVSVVLGEEEWERSASERALEQAQDRVIDLGIIMGNKGFHVISQPRGEPQFDPHRVSFSSTDLALDSLGKYFQCVLTLTEIGVDDTSGTAGEFGPPKMFDLSIGIPDLGEEHMLQRDTRLPKRRGHVMSYHISDVYMYRRAEAAYIAVFISYMTPGFEGPDIRYMVVTGKLPF
jgi:predicted secreted protein